jgi:hypothetical protein
VGLPNACGRRDVDDVRTTAGEAGAAADMVKPRKEQRLALPTQKAIWARRSDMVERRGVWGAGRLVIRRSWERRHVLCW